jgi:hypothetical protein
MKKKIAIGVFIVVCSLAFSALALTACSDKKESTTEGQLGEYRPMIFIQNTIYGETADVVSTLPENAIGIGTIEKVVSQNEPMVRENFTSNLLPAGSQVFCDEVDLNVIYVLLPLNSEARYAIYEGID